MRQVAGLLASAALRYCTAPRCPQLVTRGRCEAHTRERLRQYDERRGTAASRGYDSRWSRYRAGLLVEHPFCGDRPAGAPVTADSRCMGRYVIGKVVDHIVQVRGKDDPRFYDATNHQILCVSCHEAKRQRESLASR
jgi:5-methylcytosine-specific restriction protein A